MMTVLSPSFTTLSMPVSQPLSNGLSCPEPSKPDKPERPRRRTRKEWRQLLVDYEMGSLTVREFCSLKGLSESNFYKKRRRFLRDNLQTQKAQAQKLPSTTQSALSQKPCPGFVPVSLGDSHETPNTPFRFASDSRQKIDSAPTSSFCDGDPVDGFCEPLTLRLGPTLTLSIPQNFCEEALKKVVTVLAS